MAMSPCKKAKKEKRKDVEPSIQERRDIKAMSPGKKLKKEERRDIITNDPELQLKAARLLFEYRDLFGDGT